MLFNLEILVNCSYIYGNPVDQLGIAVYMDVLAQVVTDHLIKHMRLLRKLHTASGFQMDRFTVPSSALGKILAQGLLQCQAGKRGTPIPY